MAKVELKQPVIDAISADIADAKSVVLVDYRGLTVAEDTQLRKELREAGIVYKVYKNTMMRRAFEGTDFAGLDPFLEGPSAIAISNDDVTAPARVLAKFAKTAEALEFKAGVIEGDLYDVDGLKALASIPSREELLAKLFGSMQSPIANFARVLQQIADNGGEAAPAEEKAEEAPAEEAPAEEAPAEEAKAEEAPAEEAPAEEAKAEEAPAEEAPAEEAKAEEAKAEEEAPAEEDKEEAPAEDAKEE